MISTFVPKLCDLNDFLLSWLVTGKFIVYGSGIGPINCITSLLMFGVPAKRIEFVCQDLAEEINCFNNNDVSLS